MEGIKNWIEAESVGHAFFVAYPFALIALLLLLKKRRLKFVVPAILMSIAIVNPVFYRIWDGMNLYAYWRVLWIVPVIPTVAAVAPAITENLRRHRVVRTFVAVGFAALFGLLGTLVYKTDSGLFVMPGGNAAKLPSAAVEVADYLLAQKEHPRIIADTDISVYIRQYTGDIDTLYGRDVYGYILWPSYSAGRVYQTLSSGNGDFENIAEIMLNDGYDYLVTSDGSPEKQTLLSGSFEIVNRVQGFGIYTAKGIPSLRKERNALGQVVSVTMLDCEGQPCNGINGYSTIRYEYDQNGFANREYRTDTDGSVIVDNNGWAACNRTLDSRGNILSETRNDLQGLACERAAGFSGIVQKFDRTGGLAVRGYVDSDDKPVQRLDGYSEARWSINPQTGTRDVAFYALDGSRVSAEGLNLARDLPFDSTNWSEWMTPAPDKANQCMYVGTVNLGEKREGDAYTCQVEIEFRDVQAQPGEAFCFGTQGAADSRWDLGSVWNWIIDLENPPENGVYQYTVTSTVTETIAQASEFEIGFRCDHWHSGSFRVRKLKIERGDTATPWTPGV